MYSYESPLQVYVELMLLGKYDDKILRNKIVCFPFLFASPILWIFVLIFPFFWLCVMTCPLLYPLALFEKQFRPISFEQTYFML